METTTFLPDFEITTNEVSTDDLTLKPDKTENAVAFLDFWSQWFAAIVTYVKTFFDMIMEALG